MRELVFNHDNLIKSDIDEIVVRIKCILINSQNEVILGYSDNTYQFPGGHLESGESFEECLIREIKEETGIEIFKSEIKEPFKKITYYNKNYHNTGRNRQNDIYYYIINTDKEFNMNNANLSEIEQKYNFTVKTFSLENVKNVLIESVSDNPINEYIVKEMLNIFSEYKKENKKIKK